MFQRRVSLFPSAPPQPAPALASFAALGVLLLSACGDGTADPNSAYSQSSGSDSGRAKPEADEEMEAILSELSPLPKLPDPSDVPAGDVDKPDTVHSSGFFTLDGRLYDRYGNAFVIRGVNNAHAWFDTGGRYEAIGALDEIADHGFNAVRIVWETSDSQLDAELLQRILRRAIDVQLVPMIELHDVTGSRSSEELLRMAQYFTEADIREVLLEFEDYLLVNIANEWSGEDFFSAYEAAIATIRSADLNHTLVIDANGWGQNVRVIFEEGHNLLDADPERNLLFSTHMYESFTNSARITEAFETAVAEKLPLVVGEFGFQHGTPVQQIDVEHLLEEAARLEIGHMGWSWLGNSTDVSYLDLSYDWDGTRLTEWGERLINGEYGIKQTALTASVFLMHDE